MGPSSKDVRISMRAMRALSWKPKVSLREGLARTIAYFDRKLCSNNLQMDQRSYP
jgi:nucleoside-diphosphate-sugar epimerase